MTLVLIKKNPSFLSITTSSAPCGLHNHRHCLLWSKDTQEGTHTMPTLVSATHLLPLGFIRVMYHSLILKPACLNRPKFSCALIFWYSGYLIWGWGCHTHGSKHIFAVCRGGHKEQNFLNVWLVNSPCCVTCHSYIQSKGTQLSQCSFLIHFRYWCFKFSHSSGLVVCRSTRFLCG